MYIFFHSYISDDFKYLVKYNYFQADYRSSRKATYEYHHISHDTKTSFLAKGFGRLDNIISTHELAFIRSLYDKCFDHDDAQHKALGGLDEKGRQALPQILGPSKTFPELLDLEYHEKLKAITAEIFETDEVELRGEHMILKPAGYGIQTPWHQDQAYHDPSKQYRNINFWLPMDEATIEGGCMQFIEQSHTGPILPHTYLDPKDTSSAMVAQDQDYWSANATAVPCPQGSCTIHHSYCMHYAGPNKTEVTRRAYIVVYGVPPIKRQRPWVMPWKD